MLVRDLVVSFLVAVIATAPAMALEIAPTVALDDVEQPERVVPFESDGLDSAAAPRTEAGQDLEDENFDEDGPDSNEGEDKPVLPNRLEGPAFHRPDTDASRPVETIGGAEPDLPISRARDSECVATMPRCSRGPATVHQVELRIERRAGLGALPPPHAATLSPQR